MYVDLSNSSNKIPYSFLSFYFPSLIPSSKQLFDSPLSWETSKFNCNRILSSMTLLSHYCLDIRVKTVITAIRPGISDNYSVL